MIKIPGATRMHIRKLTCKRKRPTKSFIYQLMHNKVALKEY